MLQYFDTSLRFDFYVSLKVFNLNYKIKLYYCIMKLLSRKLSVVIIIFLTFFCCKVYAQTELQDSATNHFHCKK